MKTQASSSAPFVILALFSWGLTATPLFGQSRVLSAADLTNQADVVAVGKVSATKSEWNADKTRIVTRVTVAVSEFLKGGGDPQMSIITPGGEIGEAGEMYFGAPRFAENEHVVVFVKGGPNRQYRVAGGAQGKITVTQDATTGVMMAGAAVKLDELVSNVKSATQALRPEEQKR